MILDKRSKLHILVPDIIHDIRSEAESVAHNFEKEEYIQELERIATEISYLPIIHRMTMSNSSRVIDNDLPLDEIVLNLCDGCDSDNVPGPSVACLLEKRGGIVVGCNSQFIINTLTKNGMKEIFEQNKIATPKGFGAPRGTHLESQVIAKGMSFPLFVKISDGYGSVGVDDNSVCHNMQELIKKSQEVWMLYPNLTVEEFVDGEEYTVLLSGQGKDIIVYPPAERIFDRKLGRYQKFVSYQRNWDPSLLAHDYIKVEDQSTIQATMELAKNAYISMEGNCYGRVDIRRQNGRYYVLEVNASCGLGNGASSDFILRLSGSNTLEFLKLIIDSTVKQTKAIQNLPSLPCLPNKLVS